MARKLKNSIIKIMKHKHWNHFDFIFAKDVVDLLYKDVINKMLEH